MRVLCTSRSALSLVIGLAFTALMSLIVLCVAASGKVEIGDRLIVFWGRTILKLFNVRVRLHDFQNIPLDRGALFLFNHQSHFDIPCLVGFIPKRLRFGAKHELFQIPLFGPAMRVMGMLPISRENRGEVFRVYREAEAKFALNFNYVLAPEGSRQSEPVIGTFKKGPFIFAVNAQAPIVPVVVSGAFEVLPKQRLLPNADRWSRTIHLRFLPVVETRGLAVSDVARVTQTTHEKVLAAYEDLRQLPL